MYGAVSKIEGMILAGHRHEAVVGRGGMGVVYRATQLDLNRPVAVKLIAGALLEDDAARSRFVRESRVAASIDHPHVIPIHAAGEADGVPYLVMTYVAGDDVRGLIRREGPMPPARAARIVVQVADALDAAHAAGLVHRDVKPANVLLGVGDHAYLSDFGLARHVRSIAGGPTLSGQSVGTLDYVAPEQIRGGQVDARADVYALSCVLFFLLTGEVPFARATDEARLWAHLADPPPKSLRRRPRRAARFRPRDPARAREGTRQPLLLRRRPRSGGGRGRRGRQGHGAGARRGGRPRHPRRALHAHLDPAGGRK
jgi:serine/threonine protein kinase